MLGHLVNSGVKIFLMRKRKGCQLWLIALSCHHLVTDTDLLISSECKEKTILTICDIKIIREIAEVIPCCHLLLCEWTSNIPLRIFVKPFTLVLLVGSSRH